jgi:hypothetical protein
MSSYYIHKAALARGGEKVRIKTLWHSCEIDVRYALFVCWPLYC